MKNLDSLLPKTYHRPPPKNDQQLRLFTPAISDISPRDVRDAMELPFLSLSKHKRTEPIEYRSASGAHIFVDAPTRTGIANIYDWDLIIYCVADIRDRMNKGQTVSNLVEFAPGDFLDTVRRPNTKQYQDGISKSLERLQATSVTTNIREHDQDCSSKIRKGFSWVNSYTDVTRTINTKDGPKKIVQTYQVELCTWLYNAAISDSLILALDPDYFLLMGGYERWLYRIIRKSAGYNEWTWSLRTLFERSGLMTVTKPKPERTRVESDEVFAKRCQDHEVDEKDIRLKNREAYRKFAYDIRSIVKGNQPAPPTQPGDQPAKRKPPIPGYVLTMQVLKGEYHLTAKAIETKRARARLQPGEDTHRARAGAFALDFEAEDKAKQMCLGARLDYYAVLEEWKASTLRNKVQLKNPNIAFLGYVQTVIRNASR